ncbi:hypothetical protein Slin15195_G058470 [Septoria linicola]|uniref:Rhodopsin domain-containing protein n=1 Tax=Septoria linicola TaxID=215465 RepID=A0A9Q9AUT9_9PEZI|nr:hypothetical protein Slin15195_G058470 [Septoria linicola]
MSSPGELAADNGPSFVTHEHVQTLYGVAGAFLALAVVAVVCRALALYTKRSWGRWDDWTMLFCILPTAALAAMMCEQGKKVYGGPGRGDPFLWLKQILIDTWVIQILTITSLYVFKLSICIRYLRIADDFNDRFWKLSMLMIAILSAHYVSSFVVWGMQCVPARRFWDPRVPGTCIDQSKWIISVNGVSLVTDVLVLILPVHPVLKLKMPVKQRLAILAIFTVGGLSTVAGCLRFYHLYQFNQGTSDLGGTTLDIEVWSYIEISLGIFCGCMPSKPAFRTLYTSFKSRRHSQDDWHVMDHRTLAASTLNSSSTTKHSCFSGRKKLSDTPNIDSVDDIELMQQTPDQEYIQRRRLSSSGSTSVYARTERSYQASE